MSGHQVATIAELRAAVACVSSRERVCSSLPFGIGEMDGRLAGGGLAGDALHEVVAATSALYDDAASTLFAAGAAARFGGRGQVLWAVTRFDLYAPALEQAGLPPDHVLFVEARDDVQVLAAIEDAVRGGGLSAVVGEVARADMTATRRLQLAASDSGTPVLLLRRWRRRGIDPLAENSAAATRWRIACAPAVPLGLPGIGRAMWRVELVRQRNGNPFSLLVEACNAQGRIALPAASADRAAARDRAHRRAA